MKSAAPVSIALTVLLSSAPATAETGLIPLNDLGTGQYEGFPGGLYPLGKNTPPPAHRQAALEMAAQIVPRDAAGNPDPGGFIVMTAIGMSNAAHEFAVFERDEDRSVDRNARVVLLDTALGGQSAAQLANPDAAYWTIVEKRLDSMSLTAQQVQVVWLKEAEMGPPDNFPVHAEELRDDLEAIANILHVRYPNLKLCYLSSRTYGGYATIPLNPEPQAYESGFSVKWLIEDQIGGKPSLSYGQLPGPVRAPLLLWGAYLWADGTHPRSDGLIWLQSDFETDGTHPSAAGEQKVADLLSAFYATDVTTRPWWERKGDDAVLLPFDATKDASVDASHPTTNYGLAPQLVAGSSPESSIFVGFDTGLQGALGALAKLSMRVRQSGGGSVLEVGNAGWGETSITFANAPEVGSLLVEMPTSSRDGTIAADVTGTVQSDTDGRVSFSLTAPANPKDYHSREAGQPPRLILAAPCAGAPDSDGDLRSDICDCAPADVALFAKPGEVEGLRWTTPAWLAWDSLAPVSGSATLYDLISGDLADVAFYGTGAADVCLADDLAALAAPDVAPPPGTGAARFYLVRGDNACGIGRYQTASDGRDRLTAACP